MVFVGRDRETARIAAQLAKGGNVIVRGKFGIGRTSLVRHVAETLGDGWRFHFESFMQGPAGICFGLLRHLGLALTAARGHNLSFISARARLLRAEARPGERRVLVFDDIQDLSAAKLALVRSLALTGRHQFVAVVDEQLKEAALDQMRAALYPVHLLTLLRLPTRQAESFFARTSERLDLGLGEGEVAGLARTSCGYPLLMAEIAARLARQRRENAQGGAPRWRTRASATTGERA